MAQVTADWRLVAAAAWPHDGCTGYGGRVGKGCGREGREQREGRRGGPEGGVRFRRVGAKQARGRQYQAGRQQAAGSQVIWLVLWLRVTMGCRG